MEKLTWVECTKLTQSIYQSSPGEWSHQIEGKLVRLERTVKTPNNQVRIFYRGVDCAGSYSYKEWERLARPIELQQLTLF